MMLIRLVYSPSSYNHPCTVGSSVLNLSPLILLPHTLPSECFNTAEAISFCSVGVCYRCICCYGAIQLVFALWGTLFSYFVFMLIKYIYIIYWYAGEKCLSLWNIRSCIIGDQVVTNARLWIKNVWLLSFVALKKLVLNLREDCY